MKFMGSWRLTPDILVYIFGDSVAQSLQPEVPRTIGSMKKYDAAWIASGAFKRILIMSKIYHF